MDAFIKLKPAERSIFFEETARPRNMQAQIVEKDFWVCWTLKELFRLPEILNDSKPEAVDRRAKAPRVRRTFYHHPIPIE